MSFVAKKTSSAPAASGPTAGSTAKDVTVKAEIGDTISSLRWSRASNYLVASSWDGKARVFDVPADGTARVVASIAAEGPLFTCDWSKVS